MLAAYELILQPILSVRERLMQMLHLSSCLFRRLAQLALLGITLILGFSGCGAKQPPSITQVEGIVLLENLPLPFAHIHFVPELSGFGAEWNSMAVTDEKGHFTLTLVNGQPGAVVARHRVEVTEGPLPRDLRGPEGQAKLSEYMAKRTNRPIPDSYSNFSLTPLRVEVIPQQKNYELHLKRPTP
jgi:hypothetical protein